MYSQRMKDEVKAWLKRLSLSRDWLADKIGVSKRTVDNWLSSSIDIPERSAAMIRQIMDDSEKMAEGISTNIFSVECTLDQFRRFSRAALEDGMILEDWALQILDEEARAHFAKESHQDDGQETARTDINDTTYRTLNLQIIELPLLRAAAGAPILGDEEMVEVDRDYGHGRFLLELRGDSMAPRFQDRQRIVMRHKSTLKRPVLKYGELYAFVVDGLVTFKQWAKDKQTGERVLRSLNPEHADIVADEATDWIGWFDPADNA